MAENSSTKPMLHLVVSNDGPDKIGQQREAENRAIYRELGELILDPQTYPLLTENPGLQFRIEECIRGIRQLMDDVGLKSLQSSFFLREEDSRRLETETRNLFAECLQEIQTEGGITIAVRREAKEKEQSPEKGTIKRVDLEGILERAQEINSRGDEVLFLRLDDGKKKVPSAFIEARIRQERIVKERGRMHDPRPKIVKTSQTPPQTPYRQGQRVKQAIRRVFKRLKVDDSSALELPIE